MRCRHALASTCQDDEARSGLVEHPMTDAKTPVRVAVIGGGCAALTTAFELTRPEHMGQYEV